MEFFTASDFDLFQQVQGHTFNKNDKNHQARNSQLANGVFAKTNHWRWLIDQKGYETNYQHRWNMGNKYRKYAWARIHLNGYSDSQIYFNIGVGSRNPKDEVVEPYVFYKLDCQRDKGLSPYQIGLFDRYLQEKTSGAAWQYKSKSDALALNWEQLSVLVVDFIKAHEEHYRQLIQLVWPGGINIKPKVARLCWNDFQWQKPSGANGKSQSTSKAQEKEKGYGFEEWLFDTDTQFKGYHYSFIQVFNKGDHEGKIYDLQLFSIYHNAQKKSNEYYWVGRIKRLEVLTNEQRLEIFNYAKTSGLYDRMQSHLKDIGVPGFNFDYVEEEKMFNVRFSIDDEVFTQFENPIPIENPAQVIKSAHYVLLDPVGKSLQEINSGSYQFQAGHQTTKTGISTFEIPSTTVRRELLHKAIQEKMYHQLVAQYQGTASQVSTENPTGLGTSIDLVVHHPQEGDVFYEVKTGHSALGCIRAAIGQLLEYAFFPTQQLAIKLVIVSPHEADPQVSAYLQHLRQSLGLGIYYQQFCLAEDQLKEELV